MAYSRIPSFCTSHRDPSHGGLPEAKNQLSKFGCAILGYKKASAGTATARAELVKIKNALKWVALAQNRMKILAFCMK